MNQLTIYKSNCYNPNSKKNKKVLDRNAPVKDQYYCKTTLTLDSGLTFINDRLVDVTVLEEIKDIFTAEHIELRRPLALHDA